MPGCNQVLFHWNERPDSALLFLVMFVISASSKASGLCSEQCGGSDFFTVLLNLAFNMFLCTYVEQ